MKQISQAAVKVLVAGAVSAAVVLSATGVANAAQDLLPAGARVEGVHPMSYEDAQADAALQCDSYVITNISGGRRSDGKFHAFATCA